MKNILTFFLAFSFYLNCEAQYKIESIMHSQTIDKEVYTFGSMVYKGEKDKLYLFEKTGNIPDSIRYKISVINLENGKHSVVDTTADFADLHLKDILVYNNNVLFIGFGRLYNYSITNKVGFWFKANDTNFSKAVALNDSVAMLYKVANYHPADGPVGLELTTFNFKRNEFINHKVIPFQGAALSSMTIKWGIAANGFFRIFTPFSAKMYVYNDRLTLVDSAKVPIFDNVLEQNIAYEKQLDSFVYSEWSRVHNNILHYTKDSLESNPNLKDSYVYSKEFIINTGDEVRKKHSFIEKVFYKDESTFALSISRPGYELEFRDLLFYDFKKQKIVKKIIKWRTGKASIINKKEDFFVVDLINDEPIAPYFYKERVYFNNLYPIDSFRTGDLKKIKEMYFEITNDNGYKWQMFRFDF